MNKSVLIINFIAAVISFIVACVESRNPKLSKGITYAASAALVICIAMMSIPKNSSVKAANN